MKLKFVYWQEDIYWLGYLSDFPDYRTQAESLDELKENLADLYKDLTSEKVPCIKKVGELEVEGNETSF
jgi:hypothetical protein